VPSSRSRRSERRHAGLVYAQATGRASAWEVGLLGRGQRAPTAGRRERRVGLVPGGARAAALAHRASGTGRVRRRALLATVCGGDWSGRLPAEDRD